MSTLPLSLYLVPMKEANNYFNPVYMYMQYKRLIWLACKITTLLSLITLFLESCCNPLQNSTSLHVTVLILLYCSAWQEVFTGYIVDSSMLEASCKALFSDLSSPWSVLPCSEDMYSTIIQALNLQQSFFEIEVDWKRVVSSAFSATNRNYT